MKVAEDNPLSEFELHWKPSQDLVIVIADQAKTQKTTVDLCKMLKAVRETVQKHGFDMKHWGTPERMLEHLTTTIRMAAKDEK
ncbi:hypothetical protein WDW89_09785 [Deltaproteobacteria bacterium TL4]